MRTPGARSRALSSGAERVTMRASSSACIELEPRHDAEAVAQRVGQHAGARGGAHQRERLQVSLTERAAGPSPIMMSI